MKIGFGFFLSSTSMTQRAHLGGGGSSFVEVPVMTNYTKAPYNAWAGAWGSYDPGVPEGTWDQNWKIVPSQFPANTVLEWHYANGQTFTQVAGYSKISFMNGDAVAALTGSIIPRQFLNISKLKVDFDWAYTGSPNFNTLAEAWGAPAPRAAGEGHSSGNSYFEIAFWPYTGNTNWFNTGTSIGTFTDSDSVSWTVKSHPIDGFPAKDNTTPGKYLIAYTPNKMSGTLHYDEYVRWLAERGLMTGAEWYAGDDFGIEQINGGGIGTFTINTLGHQYEYVANNNLSQLPGNTVNDSSLYPGNASYWSWGGLDSGGSLVAGAYGSNTAVRLLENTTQTAHSFIKLGVPVVSREADYLLAASVKLIGRTHMSLAMYADGWGAGAHQQFNVSTYSAMANGSGVTNYYGGMTLLNTQVVDMQYNSNRGVFARIRKPAGIANTNIFIELNDGTNKEYTGNTSNGMEISEFRIIQDPRLIISGTPGGGSQYTSYSYTPTTFRGGLGSVTWAVSSGSLPSGLSLNSSTGQITGTPTTTGTASNITLTATDSTSQAASIGPFSIAVGSPTNLLNTNVANTAWVKTNATPTGGGTASQGFLETVTNGQHNIVATLTGQSTSAGAYRFEANISPINGRSHGHVYMAVANDSINVVVIYDLINGTIAQQTPTGTTFVTTPTITSNGDGTYKVVVWMNWPASQNTIKVRLQSMSSSGTFSFAGDTSKGMGVTGITLYRTS